MNNVERAGRKIIVKIWFMFMDIQLFKDAEIYWVWICVKNGEMFRERKSMTRDSVSAYI